MCIRDRLRAVHPQLAPYVSTVSNKIEVLYNGSCQVCSREVNHYARLTEKSALPITYDDLGDPQKLAGWGISADAAAKRLHVRKNGQTYVGLPAFIMLWREIPQTCWLAHIFDMPGIHWTAARVYNHLLAPILYWFHLRRLKS